MQHYANIGSSLIFNIFQIRANKGNYIDSTWISENVAELASEHIAQVMKREPQQLKIMESENTLPLREKIYEKVVHEAIRSGGTFAIYNVDFKKRKIINSQNSFVTLPNVKHVLQSSDTKYDLLFSLNLFFAESSQQTLDARR